MQLRELCPGACAQQVRALAQKRIDWSWHRDWTAFIPCLCRIKKGKCQFQYCDPHIRHNFFGTKHFNSYVYNGPVLKATTTPTAVVIASATTPTMGVLKPGV